MPFMRIRMPRCYFEEINFLIYIVALSNVFDTYLHNILLMRVLHTNIL